MSKIAYDLSEEEIIRAFGHANFGFATPVEIVSQGLLKCASGYYQGYTSTQILIELGLITKKYRLTTRGEKNLWDFFTNKKVNI